MASFADELLADFGSDEEQEIDVHTNGQAQPSTDEAEVSGRKREHPEIEETSIAESNRDNKRFPLGRMRT